jgi:protein-S-isoprenylcysteine O-methyltransferase Ste14
MHWPEKASRIRAKRPLHQWELLFTLNAASLSFHRSVDDNEGRMWLNSPIARTVLFTMLVPGTVAVYIPWRLRGGGHLAAHGVAAWAGIAMIVAGAAIYFDTAFWGFAVVGKGTPAPIAPTKHLVVTGLHRFVRNPMYIGVGLVVAGQAWLFHSVHIAIYLAVVSVIMNFFVLLYEEPTLHRQFGAEYDRYRARVPRWIPRIRF